MTAVAVPELDPLALDSIFLTPGRNDPCHCGSGDKYKRCCEQFDQAAWRTVMEKLRQACAVGSLLPKWTVPR